MLKVGLTGGIGSGKSTVAQLLEVLGVPVYYADDRAKLIMNTQVDVVAKIKQLLGKEAYQNKIVNRTFVAQKVFNDKGLLQKLNQIVHPAVKYDFEQWCRLSESRIVVQEAAILFENGGYEKFDRMILVTAPVQTRIKRVMFRDGLTEEQVTERINNQWPDDKKVKLADWVIVNDDKQSVIKQTIKLIKEL